MENESSPNEEKSTEESNAPKGGNQSGSGAATIIVVIIAVIVVLGVGSYFLLRYLGQGYINKLATPTATATVTETLSTTSTATTTALSSSNYIIADSSTRVISESELTSLTPWQLKVARNEIYARYGREFVHKDLECYFAKKSWYKIDANFSEDSLSTTEVKNISTIKSYEDKTNSVLASKDSGCDTNQ